MSHTPIGLGAGVAEGSGTGVSLGAGTGVSLGAGTGVSLGAGTGVSVGTAIALRSCAIVVPCACTVFCSAGGVLVLVGLMATDATCCPHPVWLASDRTTIPISSHPTALRCSIILPLTICS